MEKSRVVKSESVKRSLRVTVPHVDRSEVAQTIAAEIPPGLPPAQRAIIETARAAVRDGDGMVSQAVVNAVIAHGLTELIRAMTDDGVEIEVQVGAEFNVALVGGVPDISEIQPGASLWQMASMVDDPEWALLEGIRDCYSGFIESHEFSVNSLLLYGKFTWSLLLDAGIVPVAKGGAQAIEVGDAEPFVVDENGPRADAVAVPIGSNGSIAGSTITISSPPLSLERVAETCSTRPELAGVTDVDLHRLREDLLTVACEDLEGFVRDHFATDTDTQIDPTSGTVSLTVTLLADDLVPMTSLSGDHGFRVAMRLPDFCRFCGTAWDMMFRRYSVTERAFAQTLSVEE